MMGITSIFLTDLKNQSLFSVTFARFFLALLAELITFFILLNFEKRQINTMKTTNIRYKDMLDLYFHHYLTGKNIKTKNRMPFYLQFILMGICLIDLSIPFYFMGFLYQGVVITTISINALTIICISALNLLKKEEDFNSLYGTYLVLLLTSVFTAGLGRGTFSTQLSIEGTISIIISSISWVIFIVFTDKSSSNPKIKDHEKKSIIEIKTSYTSIVRPLFQTMMIHAFGLLLLFPTTILFAILGGDSFIANEANIFLTEGFWSLLMLTFTPNMIGVGIICTFIPYLLLTFTASIWPPEALKHDQWNSILTTLEPLMNLYIGYFIWKEAIRSDYIAITTILLFSCIVIRYFYENGSLIRFYLFLKIKIRHNDKLVAFFTETEKFAEQINVMCGTWDVIIKASTRSTKKFQEVFGQLKGFGWVDKIEYSIEKSRSSQKNI